MLSGLDFTVVIPIYNSSEFIERALESVKYASKKLRYEVLLVDDMSDDLIKIKNIIKNYLNVKLIEKTEKTNAADSRNIGIRKSSSDLIYLLDADDQLVGDTLVRRLELHKKEKVGVIFGDFINNFIGLAKSGIPVFSQQDFLRDYLFKKGGDFRSSTISIYKPYYAKSFFDEKSYKHQDWIFALKIDGKESLCFDSTPSVIINLTDPNRMSRTFNVEASKYFVENYLFSQSEINWFSKKNWLAMLMVKDKKAISFFLGLYKPSSALDYIKYYIFSCCIFLPFSSDLLKFIRFLKWKAKLF